MYLSIISSIFGILFILSGIAGFIPGFHWNNGLLFGIFYVDPIHNITNFIVGFIAIVSALKYKSDKWFFRVFGILFAILAILGFIWQGDLFVTHSNMADTILHVCLAVIFLILGFSASKEGRV
jgi:uncharacterized integral membrane protein